MRARSAVVGTVLVSLVLPALHARAASRQDPLRSQQWGLEQGHVPEAWATTRGAGVTVAVLDSGIDLGHPDLQGAIVRGRSWAPGSPSVQDDCGHGTQVAGVIAARRGNGKGIAGVAPEAKVMPLKDDNDCAVDLINDMAAIRWAADHGARVVNYSSGTSPGAADAAFDISFRADFQAAVDYAWKKGTLVVAGAGNDYAPVCAATARLQHVLCVGATGKSGQRATYSQGDATGTADFLVAPGGDNVSFDPATPVDGNTGIWTTDAPLDPGTTVGAGGSSVHPGYTQVNGTSFATPFVSGVAALLFSRGLSVQQVHDRLLHCTTDLGPAGRDPVYGFGEVNAVKALSGKGCH